MELFSFAPQLVSCIELSNSPVTLMNDSPEKDVLQNISVIQAKHWTSFMMLVPSAVVEG